MLLSACSTRLINTRIFLKEEEVSFFNLKGDTCLQSGIDIYKSDARFDYSMRETYKNCDLIMERDLREYELEQWGLERK